jgi:apolipoprotein N-acyltransferase
MAFPKAHLWTLAFLFLVPLFFAVKRSASPKETVLSSYVFGLFYFGALFNGITELYFYVSFWAYVAWIGLVLFQSLFIAGFCLLTEKIIKQEDGRLHDLFIVPSVWGVIEWIRALGPFGVTGGGVGYSLATALPLIQISSITGVYGVSFIALLSNLILFRLLMHRTDFASRFWRKRGELMILIALFLATLLFGYYRLSSMIEGPSSFRVAVIQPNIDQPTKLNFAMKDRILDAHIILTREILKSKPDLVIWPETAITTYLFYDKPVLSKLSKLISGAGSYFLVGAPEWEKGKAYNSAFLLSPAGSLLGRYDKQKLVPFGEYIPLRPLLYPVLHLTSDFFSTMDYGYDSSNKAALLNAGPRKLGVAVCFESTFPQIISDRVREGADDIVVITNDAWFFDSSLVYQHLDSGVFRAVETGVPLIQVGNTGFSAIIAPSGRIIKQTRLNRKTALLCEVPEKTRPTIYVRCGDAFILLLVVYLGLVLAMKRLSPNRAV